MTWDARDLDFESAWRGGALLPPRASGEHPLVTASRHDGMKYGDATAGEKRAHQKVTRGRAPAYYQRLAARDQARQKEKRNLTP